MDFNEIQNEIQNKIDIGIFEFKSFEQDMKNNQLIITFEEPSNQMLLCDPPRSAPSCFHKIVYGVNQDGWLTVLEYFTGKEETIPAQTKIIWNESIKL